MLDIGWQELLIVIVIALVVIGPKDLPKVVRTVGQWTGKARSYARDFQRTIEGYADESDLSAIQKEIAEANKELTEVRRDLDSEGQKLTEEMNAVDQELNTNASANLDSDKQVNEELNNNILEEQTSDVNPSNLKSAPIDDNQITNPSSDGEKK